MRVEAYFEGFVVVWVDAETRDETVNHQINILIHVGLTARERLARIEEQHLVRKGCIKRPQSTNEKRASNNNTFRSLSMLCTSAKTTLPESRK